MIKVDLTKCTGCRRCEVACTFFHTGRINRQKSRIKVLSLYELGLDGPVVCNQCQERYCMRCPDNAMSLGKDGQVIVSPTVCTLCEICEKLCPIGAIEIHDDIVYVCDLCGGKPKCLGACSEDAIEFIQQTQTQSPSLSGVFKKTKRKNASQKRQWFLKEQGGKIRKKWRERHA